RGNTAWPASDCRGDVDRFGHLLHIRSALEASVRVGVYAIRTLQGMGDAQTNQRLFSPGQRAFVLTSLIPGHELFEQIGAVVTDLRKPVQVFVVVICHCVSYICE